MTTTTAQDVNKIEAYRFNGLNVHQLITLVGDRYIAHNITPEEIVISTRQEVLHVAHGDWLVLDDLGFLSSTTPREEDSDA